MKKVTSCNSFNMLSTVEMGKQSNKPQFKHVKKLFFNLNFLKIRIPVGSHVDRFSSFFKLYMAVNLSVKIGWVLEKCPFIPQTAATYQFWPLSVSALLQLANRQQTWSSFVVPL